MDPGQRTRRNILIGGCLFIALGLVAIGVTLFVLLRLEGPSLRELRAKYGDIAAKAQAIVDARKSAQDKALQEARAKVPPNSLVPADWNFDAALQEAWLPVDRERLDTLARIHENTQRADRDALESEWRHLEQQLSLARQAGNITAIEAQFDPNTLGREGVLDAFREYVANDTFLGQFEASVNLGLHRNLRPPVNDEERLDFYFRHRLAVDLLVCKARVLAERGDQEAALRIALCLFRMALALNEDVESSWVNRSSGCAIAVRSLEPILAQGAISQEWRQTLIEHAEHLADKEMLREHLRVCAALDNTFSDCTEEPFADFLLRGRAKVAYRAYDVAEQLCALLDRPSSEWAASLDEIREQFGLNKGFDERHHDFGLVEGATIAFQGLDAVFLPEDVLSLLAMFGAHAIATIRPDILKVAFALEDFRAENGHYPPTLDALVPARIEAIPIDPITQTPIVYEQDERGYAVKLPKLSRKEPGLTVVWEVQSAP